MSRGCQVLHEKRDSSESRVKVCASCSSIKQEPYEAQDRKSAAESVGHHDFRRKGSVKEEDDEGDDQGPCSVAL